MVVFQFGQDDAVKLETHGVAVCNVICTDKYGDENQWWGILCSEPLFWGIFVKDGEFRG